MINIEGTTNKEQLELIASEASKVQEHGWIVEIGAYLGRQTVALGDAKHPSVDLTSCDYFLDVKLNESIETYVATNYNFSAWQQNTNHIDNLDFLRGESPISSNKFMPIKSPDLVVIDINMVFENLVFWDKYSKVGTTFIVNTYKHFDQEHLIADVYKFLDLCYNKYVHEDKHYSSVLRRIADVV